MRTPIFAHTDLGEQWLKSKNTEDLWKKINTERRERLRIADQLRSQGLWSFWKEAGNRMLMQYERILRHAQEHPNTVGEQAELDWQALLKEWIPPSYEIVSRGRLIYDDGTTSSEIDLIILKPGYPRGLLGYKYYIVDGVAGAFECKRTLRESHVREAARLAADIQSRNRPRTGDLRKEIHGPLFFGLLSHAHSWADQRSDPIVKIEKALVDSTQRAAKHPREILDLVCVGNLAGWAVSKGAGFPGCLGVSWRRSSPFPGDMERFHTLLQVERGESRDILLAGLSKEPDKWMPILGTWLNNPGALLGEPIPPVGFLICSILERLAWEDATLRDVARPFRAYSSSLSHGAMIPLYWKYGVLSEEAHERLSNGNLPSSEDPDWDPWRG